MTDLDPAAAAAARRRTTASNSRIGRSSWVQFIAAEHRTDALRRGMDSTAHGGDAPATDLEAHDGCRDRAKVPGGCREGAADAARAGGSRFAQGYLSLEPTVRVRLAEREGEEARAWLTVKGPGGLTRAEFEYPIPPGDARAMLGLCVAVLSKTRYRVPVGAHVWDLDHFHDPFPTSGSPRWSSITPTSPSPAPRGWAKRSPTTRATPTPPSPSPGTACADQSARRGSARDQRGPHLQPRLFSGEFAARGPLPRPFPRFGGRVEDPWRSDGPREGETGDVRRNALHPKRFETHGPCLRQRFSTLPPLRGKARGWGPRAADWPPRTSESVCDQARLAVANCQSGRCTSSKVAVKSQPLYSSSSYPPGQVYPLDVTRSRPM